MTETELVAWLVETCRIFGATTYTGLMIAAHFIGDPAIARRFHA